MDNTNYLNWNLKQLWDAIRETRNHTFLNENEKEELVAAYLARIEELKNNYNYLTESNL